MDYQLKDGKLHHMSLCIAKKSKQIIKELECRNEFIGRGELPCEIVMKNMKKGTTLTIHLKTMEELGSRKIHFWIVAATGTGKTLATNDMTVKLKAIKANYRDNWTEMQD